MKDISDIDIDAIAIVEWKKSMKELIFAQHPELDEKKVDKFLNKKIKDHCKNPKIVVINNYRNYEMKTNLLELIDYIEKYHLIIGGEGCLFVPHPKNDEDVHTIIKFIVYNKSKRDEWKKKRKLYAKGTIEWISCDLMQNNKKLKNNGLYGSLGCPSFFLFNKFIAASITNCGRQIICTASMVFENFLGIEVKYNMESEIFTFISRVRKQFRDRFPNGLDTSRYQFNNLKSKVSKKLQKRCAFPITTEFVVMLEDILDTCTDDELTIIYYKNNLMEFCKTDDITQRLRYIMSYISLLRSPDLDKGDYINTDVKDKISELSDLFDIYVTYTDPMFDRVRRTMFTDRDKVLYTDTDSTFLALNQWVTFIKEDILHNHYVVEEVEMNFIAVNVMTYILGFVIEKGLRDMCLCMNIEEEWAKMLIMKNEFYLAMIVFTNSKKRYISDAILQEGKLLVDEETGEIGYPEIKGFDFKKSTVKPFVTNFYTNLSIYGILRAPEIRVDAVYAQLMKLQSEILTAVRSGSREYYKQAKVQMLEHYKEPYSEQGVRAVLLWNCLFEDMAMELPIDVDVVPIQEISSKKGRVWLESTHPDIYKKIEKDFFNNENPLIAKMDLKVIALPKGEFKIPDWLYDIIDENKIASDILSLFYPIMESLGLHVNNVGKKVYLTNMVDL